MVCVHLKIYSKIGILIDKQLCVKVICQAMLQSFRFKLKAKTFHILLKKPQVAYWALWSKVWR